MSFKVSTNGKMYFISDALDMVVGKYKTKKEAEEEAKKLASQEAEWRGKNI